MSRGANLNRLLVKLVSSDVDISEPYHKEEAIFFLRQSTWRLLEGVESEYGFFKRLDAAIDVKCDKCGSFSLACNSFLYALEPAPNGIFQLDFDCLGLPDEAANVLSDELWPLVDIMTEEKLKTDEEWIKYHSSQMLDQRLLYSADGELIHRDDGYPLGLVFETVFFKLSDNCESCACYIR
jgi:hypothetical protein